MPSLQNVVFRLFKMLDGSYSAIFRSSLCHGSGIIIFSGSKILGGDSHAFYSGYFKRSQGQIFASMTTNLHTPPKVEIVLFQRDKMFVDFKGTIEGKTISLEGVCLDVPGLVIKADLQLLQGL